MIAFYNRQCAFEIRSHATSDFLQQLSSSTNASFIVISMPTIEMLGLVFWHLMISVVGKLIQNKSTLPAQNTPFL